MLNPEDYEDCITGEDVHRRIMDRQMQMEKDLENERHLWEQWVIRKSKEEYPGIKDRFAWRIYYNGSW